MDLDPHQSTAMATEASWMSSLLDNIELDCMYHKPPVNVTSFEKLPDEILLHIMSSLDTSDLLKTVRVCRRVQPVAQQILYGCIKEDTGRKTSWQSSLFETLRDQPGLAGLVKSIVLQGSDISNNITLYPTRSLHGDGAHHDLDKVDVQVCHARLSGLILWLLPQLTELTIGIDPSGSWDRLEPLAVLFGLEYSSGKPNQVSKLRRIPAFQNLTGLRFVGKKFPWSLSFLTKLNSIHLDRNFAYSENENQKYMLGKSKVKELSLECNAEILKPQLTLRYTAFESFVSMLPSLRSIDINLSFQGWTPNPGEWTYCATLLNRLTAVSETLEKLKLNMPPHGSLLFSNLIPVNSLVPFAKLCEITMPYYWLVDERNEVDHFNVDFSKLFSQSLGVLEVLVPNVKVGSWIAEFANQRMKHNNYANLRHIKLTVMERYNMEDYDQLRYYPGPRAKLDLMRNQGVRVELVSMNPYVDWDDEDYDPMAALFLQSLSEVCTWSYVDDVPIEMVWDFFSDKAARMCGYQAITLSHMGLPSRRIL